MKIFIISDTHFGHQGVCEFLRKDGTKLRPWTNYKEMDEFMIDSWNSTVSKDDKIYHLGDVTMSHKNLDILDKLNGTKVLIRGNHDTFKLSQYSKYFKDIRGCHILEGYILTHIPIHPESKGRYKGNIHGHTHANSLEDPWYQSCCVEQIDYKPMLFSEFLKTRYNNVT